MRPSTDSAPTTSPMDMHQKGTPVRKLWVPSIGSITQTAAASGLTRGALLAENAVVGKRFGQAVDNEGLAFAVRCADQILRAFPVNGEPVPPRKVARRRLVRLRG